MDTDFRKDIDLAVQTLKKGGLILYPTDTVWGIGCDATNPKAVEKVYALKKRDDSKALITLVGSEIALERAVEEVPEVAWQLIDAADKPVTIVYDKGAGVAENLLAPDGSLAVRLTKEEFSSRLCQRFRRPLVSTSANVSGEPTPQCFKDISKEIIEGVDYVCQSRRDEPAAAAPSMVIKISAGGQFKILRK
ncbi:MAG: Sua5/YciO/YrdC/YwlC family protein [Clostridium sp.]|nr:Sua5/YciO/YrdC/YwlC family protein [Clostridium sp.]